MRTWVHVNHSQPPLNEPVLVYGSNEFNVDEAYIKDGQLKWLYGSNVTHWKTIKPPAGWGNKYKRKQVTN